MFKQNLTGNNTTERCWFNMKKFYTGFIVAIIASVFVVSFFIGRATALKNSDENENKEQYAGTVLIPRDEEKTVNTANETKNVPVTEPEPVSIPYNDVNIPDRMIFPCGETVQKDYSQTAVYSETMGDWRAHTGIDFKAEEGAQVICVWEGVVTRVYEDRLWGNCVEISHGNNLKSVYRNLDNNTPVKKGEEVFEGQVIGFVGRSAVIEGAEPFHLHFEMWQDNLTINPNAYVY